MSSEVKFKKETSIEKEIEHLETQISIQTSYVITQKDNIRNMKKELSQIENELDVAVKQWRRLLLIKQGK